MPVAGTPGGTIVRKLFGERTEDKNIRPSSRRDRSVDTRWHPGPDHPRPAGAPDSGRAVVHRAEGGCFHIVNNTLTH